MTPHARSEAIAALGLPAHAISIDHLNEIERLAELSSLKPDTIDILTSGVESRLKDEYGEDFALLRADAIETAKTRERDKWLAVARKNHQIADTALRAIHEQVEQTISRAKLLKPESASTTTKQETLLARLLDVFEEDAADRWLTSHSSAEVLARYTDTTDDGPGRAFARVVEQRHREGALRLTDAPDPLTTGKAITDAIRARQEARIPPGALYERERIEKVRADLDRSSIQLDATTENLARALRSAGRPGVQPRTRDARG